MNKHYEPDCDTQGKPHKDVEIDFYENTEADPLIIPEFPQFKLVQGLIKVLCRVCGRIILQNGSTVLPLEEDVTDEP